MKSAPPTAPPPGRLYFLSGPADFALIGGASLLLYGIMLAITKAGAWDGGLTDPLARLAYWLSFVCNWPHFAATSFRLYHTRTNVRQYPVTALLVPPLVVAAVVGSMLAPAAIAPYFVKLYLIWSPYHFSGQTIGISLIYARRAGFAISKLERLALSGFVYGTFVSTVAAADVGLTEYSYFGVAYPSLGLPLAVATWTNGLMYASGGALLLLLAMRAVREGRLPPAVFLLPAMTQFIWFIPGGRILGFNNFVPFFHSLQYLVIAWAVQMKERMDEEKIPPSLGYVGAETLRWGLVNFGVGILIFYLLPRGATFAGLAALPIAEGTIHAGIQVHHFFVDGVIWKIKNPRVLSPLLVNLDDLVGPAKVVAA